MNGIDLSDRVKKCPLNEKINKWNSLLRVQFTLIGYFIQLCGTVAGVGCTQLTLKWIFTDVNSEIFHF